MPTYFYFIMKVTPAIVRPSENSVRQEHRQTDQKVSLVVHSWTNMTVTAPRHSSFGNVPLHTSPGVIVSHEGTVPDSSGPITATVLAPPHSNRCLCFPKV